MQKYFCLSLNSETLESLVSSNLGIFHLYIIKSVNAESLELKANTRDEYTSSNMHSSNQTILNIDTGGHHPSKLRGLVRKAVVIQHNICEQ